MKTQKKELLPRTGPTFVADFGQLTGISFDGAGFSLGTEMSAYGGDIIRGPHGSATEGPEHWTCSRYIGMSGGTVSLRQYHTRHFLSLRSVCMFLMGLDNGPKEGMPQTHGREDFPAELS